MKKALQYSFLTAFLVFSTAFSLNAQPHAGQDSGGAAVSGGRIGEAAGAPVGSGTLILITLALAYAGRKVYVLRPFEEVE
ncbi:MAG: hypothetical protein WC780_13060 [Lentimicrobiaceae bacterium]|jgi:hypothetical protein